MNFLNYHGLDWLAMALSLLAMYLLGNKNRWGFVAFVAANSLWIALGTLLIHSYGMAVGNAIFLAMNLREFLRWKAPVAS
jgi:hypothetical protein